MQEYDVKWETTLDGDSPISAAEDAVDFMRNSVMYYAPILDVTDKKTGEVLRFDMETGEQIPIIRKS